MAIRVNQQIVSEIHPISTALALAGPAETGHVREPSNEHYAPEGGMPAGWQRRALAVPVIVATVVAAGVTGGLLWASGQRSGDQPDGYRTAQAWPGNAAGYGHAPSFTLTDQTGHTIASAHFRGKVQVVSFLFPYCTTDCPLLARELALLQQALAAEGLGGKVEIVTFNVDPGGAGPRQLAAFLEQYGAAPDPATAKPHWHFLTGSPQQIKRVVRDQYHVAYWKVASGEQGAEGSNALAKRAHVSYDIKHSDVTYVVDQNGTIRHVFTGKNAATETTLLNAILTILRAQGG